MDHLMKDKASKKGYFQASYGHPVKRYCQTLDLIDDPELIQEYVRLHQAEHHWAEIREGIRSVGILEMEIYRYGNRLFMIVETDLDFNWEKAFADLAKLPIQEEWEKTMNLFQRSDARSAAEKWQLMDRMFFLYD